MPSSNVSFLVLGIFSNVFFFFFFLSLGFFQRLSVGHWDFPMFGLVVGMFIGVQSMAIETEYNVAYNKVFRIP